MRGGNSVLKRAKSAMKLYHEKELLLEHLNSQYCKIKKLKQKNCLLKTELSQVLEERSKKECFVQEVQKYIGKWIRLTNPVSLPLKNLIIKIKAQIQRVSHEIKGLEHQLRKGTLKDGNKLELRRHIVSVCEELTANLTVQQQRIKSQYLRAQSFILQQQIQNLQNIKQTKLHQLDQLLKSYKTLRAQLDLDSKQLYTTLKACQSDEAKPDDEITENSEQINRQRLLEKEKVLIELREEIEQLKSQKVSVKRSQDEHFKKLQAELVEKVKLRNKLNSMIKPRVQLQIKEIVLTGGNLLVEQKKLKKILPVVQNSEIRHIAEFLSLKAHCSRTNFESLFLALTKGFSKNMTIQNLFSRLKQQPFDMKEEDALLLSRYLVEDNKPKKVSLQMQLSAPLAVIRSVFEKVIGKIRIFTKEQVQSIWKQIKAVQFQQVPKPCPVFLQPQEQADHPPQGPAAHPRKSNGLQQGPDVGLFHAGGDGEQGRERVQGQGLRGHPQGQFLGELQSSLVNIIKWIRKIQTLFKGSLVAKGITSPSSRRTV